uniref:Secreted protein n=1 Tax=Parascaris univalens TaxID=6257 RepID=A0A914ZZA1_PARUN
SLADRFCVWWLQLTLLEMKILLFFFIVATGPCIQRVSNEVCFQLVSLSPASSALCP